MQLSKSVSSEKERKIGLGNIFKSKMATILIATVAIWILFTVLTGGNFLTTRNLSNLFRQMSITGILAIGMVFVIILGEIDLSVGSTLGLLGGIAAILNVWFGLSAIPTMVITLLLGIVIGAWNGYWIAFRNVPSFIVTLASMLVFRGILIGITGGNTVAPLTADFKTMGQAYLPTAFGYVLVVLAVAGSAYLILGNRKNKIKYNIEVKPMAFDVSIIAAIGILSLGLVLILNDYQGFPIPVFIMLVIALVLSFVGTKTIFGRRVYGIGGNRDAARLSGINVKKHILVVYSMVGLLAAVAGILLTARLNAGSVAAGQNAELDAIASCVIGGASLAGGTGSVVGALVGALVMASVDNGMSMMNTPTFWQYIVKGLILLIAVWLDISSKNKK
ncbi:sugar ABC transporter permease [Clostridium chromiireducens]|uniref:Xylose transport system permease protein XylH n=1 Tax=Clostridium chromiireducens TaxID=225345 RepID=A0A1V4IEK7_9CLOT|nr:sugar ABC transporter permease [Clostridium chromiireducens]MVX63331.1 sugar ABC transporter permease [Clostridium chromiireducens]OPJ58284.1 xylose transport system permease protein XylH [Clostridium chromiireducens]RII35576.1 sugar ABC transporter permease [Clostridium chromiireducens]